MYLSNCPKCKCLSFEMISYNKNIMYQLCTKCEYYEKSYIINKHVISGYTPREMKHA